MKPIDRIPTSKIQRASKIVGTGLKVGSNYLKHYGEKLRDPSIDRSGLDQANAEDIYNTLKSLKGSALKAAQMLSMEKNLLPQAYLDKFSLSQFSVPPLSAPLVNKTFRKYLGKDPTELFDDFDPESVAAASIGQVHRARKDGQDLAVKIQYPGVADSISSDLALVKPIALRLFNLSANQVQHYFEEVETKLTEETNYRLELQQSQEMATACAHLPGLKFPRFYPEFSSDRILTMEWMDGQQISQFAKTHAGTPQAEQIGQYLWDFYMYQIHVLHKLHADPHPGNFMVNDEQQLIVLDFGCVKAMPDAFYQAYFELSQESVFNDPERLQKTLFKLEIIRPTDSPENIAYLTDIFQETVRLITAPARTPRFDFSPNAYFQEITELGQRYSTDPKLRKLSDGRGSPHFLYVNRSFFGLYYLLHELQVSVDTQTYLPSHFD